MTPLSYFTVTVPKPQREAHSRAQALAKQQAKFYARASRRDQKRAARSQSTSSDQPAGDNEDDSSASSSESDDCDDADGGYGFHVSDKERQGHGGDDSPPPTPPTAKLSTALSLREKRAWQSLENLPSAIAADANPNLPEMQAFASSLEALADAPAPSSLLALSSPSTSSPQRQLTIQPQQDSPRPNLAFFQLWDAPFAYTDEGARGKRATLIARSIAAYRKLHQHTIKMLGKVDGLLDKEQRRMEEALHKARQKAMEKETRNGSQLAPADLQLHLKALLKLLEAQDRQEILNMRTSFLQKRADILLTRCYLMLEVQQQHLEQLHGLDTETLRTAITAAHSELETHINQSLASDNKDFEQSLKAQTREAKQAGRALSRTEATNLRHDFEASTNAQMAEQRRSFMATAEERHQQLERFYHNIEHKLRRHYEGQIASLTAQREHLWLDVTV